MKISLISLLVISLIVPLIYKNNVLANNDQTLEEMVNDYFTVIDDEGNTEIIPLEDIASEEGEEISVAEKYDVVNHIGGEVEVVDTYDSKEEAEDAVDALQMQRSVGNYSAQPFDLDRSVTIGVVYIKTSDITEYRNVNTNDSGYTNGAYGVDAAYIGTFNGKIRAKIAGVVADFEAEDVNVVAYDSDCDVSYYMVSGGYLRHYYYYGSSHALASTRVGYALSYLQADKKYYSYDGHYFYTDYASMIKDYQSGTYTRSINPNNPYYNYYQYLSHRALSSYTAADFNNMAIDSMGQSSYDASKFKNIGSAFVENQNEYTVNAMLMFGVAANESNWGRSSIAMDKNNLFGHGANDSNPYWGANGYASPSQSVQDHAYYFISRGYLDYEDWRHYGPHLGDKEGGLNVKYASDPYWGEKAACRTYFLDRQPADYGSTKMGIINGVLSNYPLYKEPSTSSTVIFKCNYLMNLPVLIVDTVTQSGKTWYKIQTDTALSSDRTSPDYSRIYDASHDYAYIPADSVTIVYEGNGKTPSGDPIPTIKMGDVNGDGQITPSDYVRVKNHILGKAILTGDALKAADMNGDGNITPSDYVRIKNIILNGQ